MGVYRIPCDDCSRCYIKETQKALAIRLREHRANYRNQTQHSAVVDHLAIGHSWGFDRAKIVNAQCNTIKRKIAESLFIRNHLTIEGNKSLFPLSIYKLESHLKISNRIEVPYQAKYSNTSIKAGFCLVSHFLL